MTIRLATIDEFEAIRSFYHHITDWLDTVPYGPGWKKDIYPSPDELKDALNKNELWLCEIDGEYAGSMIINSASCEEYSQVSWSVKAEPDQVSLIHALGIKPKFHRRGVATAMVNHAIAIAKSKGHKAMRLDVLEGNLPAENLYPKHGFNLVATIEMFYEDTGLANYKLYELPL